MNCFKLPIIMFAIIFTHNLFSKTPVNIRGEFGENIKSVDLLAGYELSDRFLCSDGRNGTGYVEERFSSLPTDDVGVFHLEGTVYKKRVKKTFKFCKSKLKNLALLMKIKKQDYYLPRYHKGGILAGSSGPIVLAIPFEVSAKKNDDVDRVVCSAYSPELSYIPGKGIASYMDYKCQVVLKNGEVKDRIGIRKRGSFKLDSFKIIFKGPIEPLRRDVLANVISKDAEINMYANSNGELGSNSALHFLEADFSEQIPSLLRSTYARTDKYFGKVRYRELGGMLFSGTALKSFRFIMKIKDDYVIKYYRERCDNSVDDETEIIAIFRVADLFRDLNNPDKEDSTYTYCFSK